MSCIACTNTPKGSYNKQNVLWSDETKVESSFWHQGQHSPLPNTIRIVKHDGGSIMLKLWARFLPAVTGEPVKIEGRMDPAKDGEILGKNLMKSAKRIWVRNSYSIHIPSGQRPKAYVQRYHAVAC